MSVRGRTLALLAALSVAVAVAACGSGGSALSSSVTTIGGACTSRGPTGRGQANCLLTLSNGEEFSCNAFPPRRTNAHAAAQAMVDDRHCRSRGRIRIPPKLGLMTRETNAVVACLKHHHEQASGFTSFADELSGPLAGEITSPSAYVTIYLTPGVAARSLPKPPNGNVRRGRFILLPTQDNGRTAPTVIACLAAA